MPRRLIKCSLMASHLFINFQLLLISLNYWRAELLASPALAPLGPFRRLKWCKRRVPSATCHTENELKSFSFSSLIYCRPNTQHSDQEIEQERHANHQIFFSLFPNFLDYSPKNIVYVPVFCQTVSSRTVQPATAAHLHPVASNSFSSHDSYGRLKLFIEKNEHRLSHTQGHINQCSWTNDPALQVCDVPLQPLLWDDRRTQPAGL